MIKPRSLMMYGVSGSTKTSQAYHMAQWLLKGNPGKKIRMIHSDGGGYGPFVDSGLIESGRVQVFDFSDRQHAISDYRKLSQGYWPRKKPDGSEYFQKDDHCKTTPAQFENIVAYIIEGMASTAEKLKTHISNQTEGVGFKESWVYTEDGETIVGLQQGHYNIIQKEVYSAHMTGFNCLPIPWLIYTSLLGKGEDKTGKETVYGPQVVGAASTASVPSWFMDCLHLNRETYVVKTSTGEKTIDGMVAWYKRHNDTTTDVPCLAKARIMPELYPKLEGQFPYGFVPLTFERGIVDYFVVLEKLKQIHMEGK